MKERLTYEELVAQIDEVPVTYVPALLIAVVERAIRDKVFKPGGIETVVRNTIRRVSGV